MSTIEFEGPPVLTPRILRELNGRIPEAVRGDLVSFLEQVIDECFQPFSKSKSDSLRSKFAEGCKKFFGPRIVLNIALVRALGLVGIDELPSFLDRELSAYTGAEAKRVGVSVDALRDVIRQHTRILGRILLRAGEASAPATTKPPVNPPEARTIADFLWTTTRLDFSLTGIFLMLEGEIRPAAARGRFLLERADESIRELESVSLRMAGIDESRDEHRYAVLRDAGLIAMDASSNPSPLSPLPTPIRIDGEPLSRTIIRDRE